MNPLVELRTVGGPQLWPTRRQKELAEQDIVSLYRARLEGFQRALIQRLQAAGVLGANNLQEKAGEVSPVSNAASTISMASTVSRAAGELGKDAFLQLLVTQMQFQDPLSPMDNTDMIAQLAQFSALEQMNNLNSTTQSGLDQLSQQLVQLSLLGAQNLISKTVSGMAADSGAAVSGRVVGVSLEDSTVLLTLEDGTKLPVSAVRRIYANGEPVKAGTPALAEPAASAAQDLYAVVNPDVTESAAETTPIGGGI